MMAKFWTQDVKQVLKDHAVEPLYMPPKGM